MNDKGSCQSRCGKTLKLKTFQAILTLVNVNVLAKARTYRLRQFQRYG